MKPGVIWLGLLGLAAALPLAAADRPKITAMERSQGWRLIFDGKSLNDWRGYGLNRVPANWTVADDWATNSGGPGLISEEDFQDFELQLDWKVAEGGSAQIYLRADEEGKGPEETGLLVELAGARPWGATAGCRNSGGRSPRSRACGIAPGSRSMATRWNTGSTATGCSPT